MDSAYERALAEIRQIEARLGDLRTFVRMHNELWPKDASVADERAETAENEPETELDRLVIQALAEKGPMRVRNLFEAIVALGYEPAGKTPHELLRNRLYRSRCVLNRAGVFHLPQQANAAEFTNV